MSAETQEAQSRGHQVSASQFKRLRRTAAGAAGRLKGLLHFGGGRKHIPPPASVSLLQLRGEEDLDPATRYRTSMPGYSSSLSSSKLLRLDRCINSENGCDMLHCNAEKLLLSGALQKPVSLVLQRKAHSPAGCAPVHLVHSRSVKIL